MAGLHFYITGDNDNLMRKLSETKRGVSDASNLIEKEGVSIESMFGRMAKGALALSAGISAKEIVSNVMQIRGEFQKLEVSFNTMLGSEQKANDLMQQLVKTAATTPFDLQSVAGGAKQLLAYGDNVENVNEDLIRLGNIASGLSQPLNDIVYLYGTTMTQGRLYTADFNQFTGRGIPMIKELAKQFGVAESEVKGLVESGKVGFPEVQKVIQSLTNEGGMFFNLMEEQSKTIPGQISNIGDAIDSIYNNLGKQSEGVINDALSGVSYLVENYEAVGKTILELAATYGAYKAVLITISALQKLNLMVLQQAILEKKLAAKATVILSNSEAIAAAKTRLLAIAQGGLTKAIKSTTAAMFSNPYIIAAAAIAGVAFAIYKVVTAETEFDKANKRLNDTTTSVEKSLMSEVSKLTSLERKLSEAKKGTEEYNGIKKTIVDNYSQYYKGLDGEIERVGNLSTVYGQLVEKMRLSIGQRKFESFFKAEQDNLDNTIGEKLDKAYDILIEKYGKEKGGELYQQVFDYAIRGASMSSDIWNQINGATFKEWGFDNSPVGFSIRSVSSLVLDMNQATRASSKVLDEFKEKYQMTEEEVAKILSGGKNAGNDDPVENKTLKQLLIDINSAENKLKSLQNQSKQGVISVDKVKEQTDVLSKLTGQYRLMTGKEYGSVKEDDKTIKTKQEQSDLLLEISRNAKERENAERQTAFEIEQAKIDVMKDGFLKEQAQIELNHRKALQGITLRSEEMLKAQQEAERKQWEKDGKKGVFTPKTTSVSQLPTEQLQQLSELMNGVVAKTNNDNQMLIDGMVKQYQTYAEKRKEIEKKFDDDIRSMQEKNTDGKYDAKIKEASKQRTEALAELDIEANKTTSAINKLFGDMRDKTLKDLDAINEAGEEALKFLQNGQWDATTGAQFGISEETFETWSKSPDKLKDISDALIDNKKAADSLRPAFDKVSGGLKKIFSSGGDTKKFQEGLTELSEGMNSVMQAGQFLSDSLSELGDAFGNDTLSGIAEGVNVAMDAMGSAMDGAKAGAAFGPWGAAAGAAIGMVTSLASSFAKIHDAKNEKRIQVLQDQIETLDKSYEMLGDAIDKAYSKDASQLIEQQNELLEQQKVLIQQQIREEDDKKKTDKDKIKDWQNQLEDIDKTLANNKEKAVDAIFGEDLKSAIDNFAQAYADAWASGEDRAKSMKDVAKNMIRNTIIEMIKSSAGLGETVKKIRSMIEGFLADDVINDWEQGQLDAYIESETARLDGKYDWADKYMKEDKEFDLGISSDSIADTIAEGLADGKSGFKDFASSFEDMMKTAVLNSLKTKYLEGPLKEFQKKFSDMSESGGQLTEAEIEELRGMYADIINGAKAQFDGMKDIAGLDFNATDSDNTLKGAYAKASQESIDLLAGQFGAMRVDSSATKDNTAAIRGQMQFIYNLQREGWQEVRAIRDLTDKVDKNTEQIAENTKQIRETMGEIGKDTRRSADALDGGRIDVNIKGM